MATTRIVDNHERPAQPEPDEDEALHTPPIREEARELKPDERPEGEPGRHDRD